MSVDVCDPDEIALAAGQRRVPLRAALAASVTLSRCLEAERPRLVRGFRTTVPPKMVTGEAPAVTVVEPRRVA